MLIKIMRDNKMEYHVTNSIIFEEENKKLILDGCEILLSEVEFVVVNGVIEYSEYNNGI